MLILLANLRDSRPLVAEDVECYDDMIEILEKTVTPSRTSRLWPDCLIKPVMILMLFVQQKEKGI